VKGALTESFKDINIFLTKNKSFSKQHFSLVCNILLMIFAEGPRPSASRPALALADSQRPRYECRLRPCVDGSPSARVFRTFAQLVGATMCPTCWCGAWCRWP
jgi:hypothetical protein